MVKNLLSICKALDWNIPHTERKKRRDRQMHIENDWPKHQRPEGSLPSRNSQLSDENQECNAKCYTVMQRRPKTRTSQPEMTSRVVWSWATEGQRTQEWGKAALADGLDRTWKPDSAVDQDSSFHLLMRRYYQKISKKWAWDGQEIQKGPCPAKELEFHCESNRRQVKDFDTGKIHDQIYAWEDSFFL